MLRHLVATKEIWLAAIDGEDFPGAGDDDPASLLERHDAVAPRWLDTVRDIDRRGAWEDRLIDALCDPPESFVVSSVVGARAHLRRRAPAAGAPDPARRRATTSTPATRSTGSAPSWGRSR